ncbi:DMT family transporter [Altererythrobacter sp. BO-6]|uniref:DMT family transporter n=1 Tax=Altererythrobacter sp. BO-6 TaxID=2604537 RepID=UPI0013E1C95B|nr:DMT family transporter [Altererythrobacter sp. BO-6]QIG54354.1 DMT family transporter [Altererythrobacter sp. BO-6]
MSDAPAPHALLRPNIAIPFLLVALIWGSTWFVITTQIAAAPALWSVTWRFAMATPAMFALALVLRYPLAMPRPAHLLALAMGLFQFCGNYVFVYMSEFHLTSGIVALLIGMMLVPNAILGRMLLGEPITRRFMLGSAIALGGIGLLLLNEARVAPLGGNVALGTGLALIAMVAASIANVIQAGPTGKSVPLVTLLAWSMLYGTLIDGGLAWFFEGPPVVPTSQAYWLGTAWLAIAGSVVTFPLYYDLVRKLGAGRAAYNGVLVVVIAMAISTMFEGYRWTALSVCGAVLSMIGLVVALRARQVARES